MNDKFIIEPIEFLFESDFFKGFSDVEINNVIIVEDIDEAIMFAFEQDLPSNYKIWGDIIENYRGKLRGHADFQNALDFIDNKAAFIQNQNSSIFLEYRKSKIKKTNSKHDDFVFSESREDAYFVLSTIAINRYLNNYVDDGFLEGLFNIYKIGGWPCGLKGHCVLVYNPAMLM